MKNPGIFSINCLISALQGRYEEHKLQMRRLRYAAPEWHARTEATINMLLSSPCFARDAWLKRQCDVLWPANQGLSLELAKCMNAADHDEWLADHVRLLFASDPDEALLLARCVLVADRRAELLEELGDREGAQAAWDDVATIRQTARERRVFNRPERGRTAKRAAPAPAPVQSPADEQDAVQASLLDKAA